MKQVTDALLTQLTEKASELSQEAQSMQLAHTATMFQHRPTLSRYEFLRDNGCIDYIVKSRSLNSTKQPNKKRPSNKARHQAVLAPTSIPGRWRNSRQARIVRSPSTRLFTDAVKGQKNKPSPPSRRRSDSSRRCIRSRPSPNRACPRARRWPIIGTACASSTACHC